MKLFFAALMLFAVAAPAAAQWLDRPWPGIPRTADGKPDLTAAAPRGADGKPDLSGIWNGEPPLAELTSADLQPWTAELVRQRQQEYFRTRPYYLCQPSGPETERFAAWRRILQTPTTIAILNEDLTYRVIHIDGRELEPDPPTSWMGFSVGHWDGDTLVVESAGFNDKTWLSRRGVAHTEALRMTERYRRTDFGHLQVEVTFTDPEAFKRPWGFTVDMTLAADTEMLESVCERSSETWAGSLSDASERGVAVPVEVLQRYVGAYTGIYARTERTYEISIVDGQLAAKIIGDYNEVGLGAADLEEGAPRTLVPLSETLFEGLGLGYRFEVSDSGEPTALIVTHVSGDYRYARQR